MRFSCLTFGCHKVPADRKWIDFGTRICTRASLPPPTEVASPILNGPPRTLFIIMFIPLCFKVSETKWIPLTWWHKKQENLSRSLRLFPHSTWCFPWCPQDFCRRVSKTASTKAKDCTWLMIKYWLHVLRKFTLYSSSIFFDPCCQKAAQISEDEHLALHDICCCWIWVRDQMQRSFNKDIMDKHDDLFENGCFNCIQQGIQNNGKVWVGGIGWDKSCHIHSAKGDWWPNPFG